MGKATPQAARAHRLTTISPGNGGHGARELIVNHWHHGAPLPTLRIGAELSRLHFEPSMACRDTL
ncbi:hypothetical protein [Bradyrhizobium sp. HKCCYLS2038]|uniref:hypothetical protein n=1 Tax=Bradyrhizobium sp. HKCCYLS2038 TaxID=3420764 RepID=UPI003EB81D94